MLIKNWVKRRTRLSVATVAAATLVLSACTMAEEAESEPAIDSTETSEVAGGEITVVVSQDALPGNVLGSFANNWPWSMAVFETVIRVDQATQEVSFLLATGLTVAEDGLSVDMILRDDVTFHSGRSMTAEDVKFSYESAADPEFAAQLGFVARQFTGINVTGNNSLTIEFANPIPNLNEFLAEVPIIDSETVAGLADGTNVVGTGPYVFAEWNPGASFVLEKFLDYRDESYASLDTINYEVIANSTAAVSAARTGRADIVYGLTTTDTQGFASGQEFAVLDAGGVIYPLGMNSTVAPFDDVRVRQAVLHGVDRARINDQVFQGTGTLTNLFWGPSTPGYSEELASTYEYDPERAVALLAEAGVSDLSVEVVFMATPIQTSRYEIFANSMAAIGITTTAVGLDPPTYISRQSSGDLGSIFLAQHGQVGRGPITMLSSLPTLREGNPSQFYNAEYESLRNDLILAPNAQASEAALKALSEYMINQAFIASEIQAPQQILVSSALQGLKTGPFGELFAESLILSKD